MVYQQTFSCWGTNFGLQHPGFPGSFSHFTVGGVNVVADQRASLTNPLVS